MTNAPPAPLKRRRAARLLNLMWDEQEHDYRVLCGVYTTGRIKAGKFGFPGGGLEPGETPAEAALREITEETGCVGTLIETVQPYLLRLNEPAVDISYFLAHMKNPEIILPNWRVATPPTNEMKDLAFRLPMEVGARSHDFLEGDGGMWESYANTHIQRLKFSRWAGMLF